MREATLSTQCPSCCKQTSLRPLIPTRPLSLTLTLNIKSTRRSICKRTLVQEPAAAAAAVPSGAPIELASVPLDQQLELAQQNIEIAERQLQLAQRQFSSLESLSKQLATPLAQSDAAATFSKTQADIAAAVPAAAGDLSLRPGAPCRPRPRLLSPYVFPARGAARQGGRALWPRQLGRAAVVHVTTPRVRAAARVPSLIGAALQLINGLVFVGEGGPSPALMHSVGGMLAHMADSIAVFAPHANSYRRLRPSEHAPTFASWGHDNRSAAVRVISAGAATRIEHRVAGADSNPYLVLAMILGAALDGMAQGTDPGAPIAGDSHTPAHDPLPTNWDYALRRFSESDFAQGNFGMDYLSLYTACKEQELAEFSIRVTDVEYDAYIRTA